MSENIPEISPGRVPEPGSPNHSAVPIKKKNWLFFALGFIGWYLVNGIFWWLIPMNENYNIFFGIVTLPVNLLVLLVLSVIRRTRWIGFGILAAIALNLLISLVLGLFQQAVCLVPFFLR